MYFIFQSLSCVIDDESLSFKVMHHSVIIKEICVSTSTFISETSVLANRQYNRPC